MPNKNELRTALKHTRISALLIIGLRLLNSINRDIGFNRLRILIKDQKIDKTRISRNGFKDNPIYLGTMKSYNLIFKRKLMSVVQYRNNPQRISEKTALMILSKIPKNHFQNLNLGPLLGQYP